MAIAQEIVDNSSGRARLAFNEKDDSKGKLETSAHFIKIDGRRVGRDIELYGCEAGLVDWEIVLTMFFEEVLLPVRKSGLEDSYKAAAAMLRNLGHEVFKPNLIQEWDELF